MTEETARDEFSYEWKYKIPEPDNNYRYKGKITLYYGPYEVLHIIKHLPNKLRGLKDLLSKEGYKVVYVPWEHYDLMAVCVNDTIIYTCKYSNMDFDGFGQDCNTKEAFNVTMNTLKRINGCYFINHFKEKCPMDFFDMTIGK